MVHQHICARSIDQHICAILIFLADFQGQLDSHRPFLFFSVVQAERMVLNIKRYFPFKFDLNLPDQSQFHKTPTAGPPHLQPGGRGQLIGSGCRSRGGGLWPSLQERSPAPWGPA